MTFCYWFVFCLTSFWKYNQHLTCPGIIWNSIIKYEMLTLLFAGEDLEIFAYVLLIFWSNKSVYGL